PATSHSQRPYSARIAACRQPATTLAAAPDAAQQALPPSTSHGSTPLFTTPVEHARLPAEAVSDATFGSGQAWGLDMARVQARGHLVEPAAGERSVVVRPDNMFTRLQCAKEKEAMDAVARLPEVSLQVQATDDADSTCCICLDNLTSSPPGTEDFIETRNSGQHLQHTSGILMLLCGHRFHRYCITMWLSKKKACVCPLCNSML
ncbi:hypothetical protein CYMTET_22536, partial [Cymbomonas tetramitiformis]